MLHAYRPAWNTVAPVHFFKEFYTFKSTSLNTDGYETHKTVDQLYSPFPYVTLGNC